MEAGGPRLKSDRRPRSWIRLTQHARTRSPPSRTARMGIRWGRATHAWHHLWRRLAGEGATVSARKVPWGGWGPPDEMAAAVMYLMSPQAQWASGAVLDLIAHPICADHP